jgi:putative ABC transport system permease protein
VAATCALSTVLFGLLPALRASRGDPADVLAGDARSGGGRGLGRFRDALVVFEIAASLVLLVGTGLTVRSFAALGSVDPGYATRGLLTWRLALPFGTFRSVEARRAFEAELLDALREIPGVERAATVSQLPLTGSGPLQPYAYDEETASSWESVTADRRWIAPGFFETVGAHLLEGRDFTSEDVGLARIIVDERLAARAFPGRSAVGERLQVNPNDAPEDVRYAQVVGVVSHLRLHDLARPHLTQIYWASPGLPQFSVVLRASGDPEGLAPAVRDVVARLAPGAPVEDLRTMEDLVGASLAPARLAVVLMTVFGATALLLACVGIYGVLSNVVSTRTREIGVRLALGARKRDIRRQFLLEASLLSLLGGIVGTGLGAVAAFGVRNGLSFPAQLTPEIAALGLALSLVVGLVAGYWPARQASNLPPVDALRSEA